MPDRADVPLLRWDDGTPLGVSVGVTTRHGGVSGSPYDTLNLGLHVGDSPACVATNRARAAAAFGVTLDTVVFAQQVHGAQVAVVGRDDGGRGARADADAVPGTDALVTSEPGVTLAMMVADCVPLALVDPVRGVLAAVHAGWRGTAAGVAGAAVDAMRSLGARPERVRAFLGPAVAPDRYQVTDEVRDALAAAVGPEPLDEGAASADEPGHWLVDLIAANRQQLRRAGLLDEHIGTSGRTTADPDLFSDRAQRPCGRFALLACRRG
ncbi:MAG TPA: peptidoglycan editing factor PgeF [Acidimicrobiales bacterium]|nr:peptidoglycan editing factor PgeF [Acidimicrobiales bacterium]